MQRKRDSLSFQPFTSFQPLFITFKWPLFFFKKPLNVLNQKYLDTSSSCPAFGHSVNTGSLFLPNMLIQRSLFWCLGICLNINPHPAD